MGKFRFEDLEIWREACRIGDCLDVIAERFDERKQWRYAEQLRGAALSISNNIAEGSGSNSQKDFQNFLNIARRSVAENANIVLFLMRKKILSEDEGGALLDDLRALAARITAFSKSLAP
jgi:four helix bundle protein